MGAERATVATTAGPVAGTIEAHADRRVRVFRGIPYAAPPVGRLRFAAPEPVEPWRATRDATAFGPGAPQTANPMGGLVPGMAVSNRSEDCLTLNVWTPGASGASRPVLVWFHGGSFVMGASSQPAYDGARYAAEQGIVLVTANYRLGALGFLDVRSVAGAGAEVVANCGLRDAIAALEWVRENIEAFGGDPEQVTVFGESAGGGVALHLCASPRAHGLFQSAIVQSGATFATLDEERAALVAATTAATLDSSDVDSLRALRADEIAGAQGRVQAEMLKPVGMMPFHPCVDGDVLPRAPRDALADGAFAGRALLVGTTSDEMRLFVPEGGEPPAPERLRKRVARYLNVDDSRADAVVATYAAALGTDDGNEIWAALFSDQEMQVPARAMLDAHAAHGPAFSYLFTWPAANPHLRACHGIDIPFTFGTLDVDGWDEFVGADRDAIALSDRMRAAWSAFARDGSPGWGSYTNAERTVHVFGRADSDAIDPLRPRLSSLVSSGR